MKNYWKKPWVRLATAVIVIVLFSALQYRLANIPLVVDLSDTKIPPIRQGEQLTISGLSAPDSNKSLLTHRGEVNQEPQFFFDQARLPENVRTAYGVDQRSTTPQRMQCLLFKDPKTPAGPMNPCATDFEAKTEQGQKAPEKIVLFQAEEPGTQNYRSVSFRLDTPVLFQMSTNPPAGPPGEDEVDYGPGCVKQLIGSNGNWVRKLKGSPLTIAALSEAEAPIKLRFLPLDVAKPIWPGGDGMFEPFFNVRLDAKTVSITSNGKSLFEAKTSGEDRLQIDRLYVGSDQLQMHLIGRAYVTANGVPITQDFVKRIEQNRILAGLFIALNGALITWFISSLRALFTSSDSEEKKPAKKKKAKK